MEGLDSLGGLGGLDGLDGPIVTKKPEAEGTFPFPIPPIEWPLATCRWCGKEFPAMDIIALHELDCFRARRAARQDRIIDLETQIAGPEAARSHNPTGWTDSF